MRLDFETCDVFTDRRFGGNPLAVVYGADRLDSAAMRAVAREFNLSETVFVTREDAEGAYIRIFTPGAEVPFAGHPNVGAAVLLARRRARPWGGDPAEVAMVIDQAAGRVGARVRSPSHGRVAGARIEAPQPFGRTASAPDAGAVAACAGLPSAAIREDAHPPAVVGCGLPFAVAEVSDLGALATASPDASAFRRHLPLAPGAAAGLHLYVKTGPNRLRARMFSPLDGIGEDPATGSANCALAGLLLDIAPAGTGQMAFEVEQGVEMGRPSRLELSAGRRGDAIHVSVGGGVVPVMSGTLELG